MKTIRNIGWQLLSAWFFIAWGLVFYAVPIGVISLLGVLFKVDQGVFATIVGFILIIWLAGWFVLGSLMTPYIAVAGPRWFITWFWPRFSASWSTQRRRDDN